MAPSQPAAAMHYRGHEDRLGLKMRCDDRKGKADRKRDPNRLPPMSSSQIDQLLPRAAAGWLHLQTTDSRSTTSTVAGFGPTTQVAPLDGASALLSLPRLQQMGTSITTPPTTHCHLSLSLCPSIYGLLVPFSKLNDAGQLITNPISSGNSAGHFVGPSIFEESHCHKDKLTFS
jgi:hypothetical protein